MDEFSDRVRGEAADWFVRMREPDAADHQGDLATWRAADPDHDAAYRQLQQQWDRSRFGAGLDIVKNRDLGRAARWYRQPAARFAAAACLVLVLAIGLFAIIHRPAGSIAVAYGSEPGSLRSLTLSDGTRMLLDADSEVTVAMSSGDRRVELVRGRARFDVAPGSTPSFVASVAGAIVTTSNSSFDLGRTPHGAQVAVIRGQVEVRGLSAAGRPASLWRLTASQQLAVAPGNAPRAVAAEDLRWPDGMLSFDGERLDDAIAMINRYNRQHLRLSDPATGDRRITGAFHARDPGGFASAIAAMFGMIVVADSDGTIVLNPAAKKIVP